MLNVEMVKKKKEKNVMMVTQKMEMAAVALAKPKHKLKNQPALNQMLVVIMIQLSAVWINHHVDIMNYLDIHALVKEKNVGDIK